jgi:hypothetical protein
MTRPSPLADGSMTVSWRVSPAHGLYFGWALSDLNPHQKRPYENHGSFVCASGNLWFGLGTRTIDKLPSGRIANGDILSLRYDPVQGTMRARVNDDAEYLCYTDLRNDLVPAVFMSTTHCSCSIVD